MTSTTADSAPDGAGPTLWAVSDVHVGHKRNRPVVEDIHPEHPGDWLIVAGDVAERADDIRWTLALLAERFDTVVWVPGNHELWTSAKDPVQLRGVARYDHLVALCRELGVVTPEDPYPVWEGADGPVTIVPMFLLYDYSFLPDGTSTRAEGLTLARDRNVVATDEYLLGSEPYVTRDAWCRARVQATRARLDALPADTRTVLVNHFPLVREPTRMLMYPEFALWCGTTETADWHVRYRADAVVYGHLHIPRTTYYDGVRFEEVSLGYPREWERRGLPDRLLRKVLPDPRYKPGDLNKFGGHFPMTPQAQAQLEADMAAFRLRRAQEVRELDEKAARERAGGQR